MKMSDKRSFQSVKIKWFIALLLVALSKLIYSD